MISALLKGLQSLTEYSKIRSNRLLLNYLTKQERNNMPNEVFVHKNCRRDCTNPSRKKQKQENIINDNCVKSTEKHQRETILIGKHIFFCGEVCDVDKKHPNRNKGWHKVDTLSFQTSQINAMKELTNGQTTY